VNKNGKWKMEKKWKIEIWVLEPGNDLGRCPINILGALDHLNLDYFSYKVKCHSDLCKYTYISG
jgi:hypothetical protein